MTLPYPHLCHFNTVPCASPAAFFATHAQSPLSRPSTDPISMITHLEIDDYLAILLRAEQETTLRQNVILTFTALHVGDRRLDLRRVVDGRRRVRSRLLQGPGIILGNDGYVGKSRICEAGI
ncbi:hypothetical protein PRIPAC_75447 [Pristionchus pacificus]|uniref:Uncharacterized protein n=1 Tax=Pristionchus pacificus TaxID=54126 RepID=A0A2A6C047_PRIPA|nr:hypothetical protein PRIPAC_75447 [Pristionchus pacificus]|eukprot:PDM71554.1 hypothetical protein PRIPAC_37961 [Pristionchus pacificus]